MTISFDREGINRDHALTSRLWRRSREVRAWSLFIPSRSFGCILEAARCLDQTFPSKWPILATKSLESRELYEIVNGENRRQFFLDTPEKMIGRSARIILVEPINLILIKQQLITSGRPVALGGMRHGLGGLLIGNVQENIEEFCSDCAVSLFSSVQWVTIFTAVLSVLTSPRRTQKTYFTLVYVQKMYKPPC